MSRSSDYAVRAALHLACQREGELVSISEIAKQRKLPLAFVRRIVARLVEAGLVHAVRGPRGGVALARSAEDISLLDVVVAMEGPLCASPCLESPEGCPFGKSCPVQGIWASSTELLENHLRAVRLSGLAAAEAHRTAHRKALTPRSPQGKPHPRIRKEAKPWTS
ncbi:MAG: Rrf2 family transcriptional regulator [Fibrobacteria bacterium]|nr:Rrf2 family transcriptional regulator [Fibrobacteria bacterium]